ncbi:hypothetical protein TCAL_15228 [Tigriopus californicus]|uniref:Uncharacterized protein n=1 Tax=Tigriopus californicus TaxID=6832 RepID=A0A553NEE1_TIGCA|nr:hypothetical protein TCAL_15228 [Tigriopus californicus]
MIFSTLLLVSTVILSQGLAQNYQAKPPQQYQVYQPSEGQDPYYPPLAQTNMAHVVQMGTAN